MCNGNIVTLIEGPRWAEQGTVTTQSGEEIGFPAFCKALLIGALNATNQFKLIGVLQRNLPHGLIRSRHSRSRSFLASSRVAWASALSRFFSSRRFCAASGDS